MDFCSQVGLPRQHTEEFPKEAAKPLARRSRSNLKSRSNIKSRFDCDRCDYSGTRRQHFENHKRAVHDVALHLKCERCPYRSSDYSNFRRHGKQVHDKEEGFKCDVCKKAFTIKGDLRRHQKTKIHMEAVAKKQQMESKRENHVQVEEQVTNLQQQHYDDFTFTQVGLEVLNQVTHVDTTMQQGFERDTDKKVFIENGDLRRHHKTENHMEAAAKSENPAQVLLAPAEEQVQQDCDFIVTEAPKGGAEVLTQIELVETDMPSGHFTANLPLVEQVPIGPHEIVAAKQSNKLLPKSPVQVLGVMVPKEQGATQLQQQQDGNFMFTQAPQVATEVLTQVQDVPLVQEVPLGPHEVVATYEVEQSTVESHEMISTSMLQSGQDENAVLISSDLQQMAQSAHVEVEEQFGAVPQVGVLEDPTEILREYFGESEAVASEIDVSLEQAALGHVSSGQDVSSEQEMPKEYSPASHSSASPVSDDTICTPLFNLPDLQLDNKQWELLCEIGKDL